MSDEKEDKPGASGPGPGLGPGPGSGAGAADADDDSTSVVRYTEYQLNPVTGWCIPPSQIDRYTQRIYQAPDGADLYVHSHDNGICIVGLAQCHPIRAQEKIVSKVEYEISREYSSNARGMKTWGKRKKGADWLQVGQTLCTIHCCDGSSFVISSCIRGKLIECNAQLIKHPDRIQKHPVTSGYLVLILMKYDDLTHMRDQNTRFITPQRYQQQQQQKQQAGAHETPCIAPARCTSTPVLVPVPDPVAKLLPLSTSFDVR